MDTIIRGLKERHYIGALMPHFRGLPYDLLFRVRSSYSVKGNTYQFKERHISKVANQFSSSDI